MKIKMENKINLTMLIKKIFFLLIIYLNII
jgi:hypothetical protein